MMVDTHDNHGVESHEDETGTHYLTCENCLQVLDATERHHRGVCSPALPWPLDDAQIDALPPRKLDAYVAERIFGREIVGFYPVQPCGDREVIDPGTNDLASRPTAGVYPGDCICRGDEFLSHNYHGHFWGCFVAACRYSTDWDAMRELVERMHEQGECSSLIWKAGGLDDFIEMAWEVTFRHARAWSVDKSLPVAVCRAALKAVRGKG